MTRHTDEETILLNCWLVWHGINLADVSHVEITGYGYMMVTYPDEVLIVTITEPFTVSP